MNNYKTENLTGLRHRRGLTYSRPTAWKRGVYGVAWGMEGFCSPGVLHCAGNTEFYPWIIKLECKKEGYNMVRAEDRSEPIIGRQGEKLIWEGFIFSIARQEDLGSRP